MSQRQMRDRKSFLSRLINLLGKQRSKEALEFSVGKSENFVLTFAGDTGMGESYIAKISDQSVSQRLKTDPFSFFQQVFPLVQESDCLIVNLETCLSDKQLTGLEGKAYPNQDQPGRTLKMLKRLGVGAVTLANNHTMDFGPDALMHTIKQLSKKGIRCFGAGSNLAEAKKPLKIKICSDKDSRTIYFFSALHASRRYRKDFGFFAKANKPGVNPFNIDRLKKKIEKIKKKDSRAIVVVCPHWQGFDYKWLPAKIHETCNELIGAGADYVIGHGTHKMDLVSGTSEKAIFYSIGNFVFNSPGRYKKLQADPYSAVVKLEIHPDEGWRITPKIFPIVTDNKSTAYQSRPVSEPELNHVQQLYGQNNTQLFVDKDDCGTHLQIMVVTQQLQKEAKQLFLDLLKEIDSRCQVNHYPSEPTLSTRELLQKEFKRRGYDSAPLDKYLFVNLDGASMIFHETETTNTSLLGFRILKDKKVSQQLFRDAGISVAEGKYFSLKEKETAARFAAKFDSCVVKPSAGRKGQGVSVGVCNPRDFNLAWDAAKSFSTAGIIVEQQFVGLECKFLVVGGKFVAAYLKVPPFVRGDGRTALKDLLSAKTELRKKSPHLYRNLLEINQYKLNVIKQQGFDMDSVPESGDFVLVDYMSSISSGGETFDYTDEVHQSFTEIAELASKTVPGVDIVGVDIIAKDFRQQAQKDNHVLIEANTRPGIGGHVFPVYGKPRDVIKEIVDYAIETGKTQHSSSSPAKK